MLLSLLPKGAKVHVPLLPPWVGANPFLMWDEGRRVSRSWAGDTGWASLPLVVLSAGDSLSTRFLLPPPFFFFFLFLASSSLQIAVRVFVFVFFVSVCFVPQFVPTTHNYFYSHTVLCISYLSNGVSRCRLHTIAAKGPRSMCLISPAETLHPYEGIWGWSSLLKLLPAEQGCRPQSTIAV